MIRLRLVCLFCLAGCLAFVACGPGGTEEGTDGGLDATVPVLDSGHAPHPDAGDASPQDASFPDAGDASVADAGDAAVADAGDAAVADAGDAAVADAGDAAVADAGDAAVADAGDAAVADAGDAAVADAGDAGPVDAGPVTALGLWIDGTYNFREDDLMAPGSPTPSVTCLSTNGEGASAFDGDGNLWLQNPTNAESGALTEWSATQLAAGDCTSLSVPAATVPFTTSATVAGGMAFDSSGTLWVTTSTAGTIVGFAATQLKQSASLVTPKYTIIPEAGATGPALMYDPLGVAFDKSGNMWVGNWYSVLEFSGAQLSTFVTGGSAINYAPAEYLTNELAISDGSSLMGSTYTGARYVNVASDANGDLWVSVQTIPGSGVNGEVQEFAPSLLSALGTKADPTPTLTLTENPTQAGESLEFEAMAFDGDGNLWIGTTADSPGLFRYPAAEIADAGAGAYDISIDCPTADCGYSLSFNPVPSGLPIHP